MSLTTSNLNLSTDDLPFVIRASLIPLTGSTQVFPSLRFKAGSHENVILFPIISTEADKRHVGEAIDNFVLALTGLRLDITRHEIATPAVEDEAVEAAPEKKEDADDLPF